MKAIVSNGTNRFQLAPLAASLQTKGVLAGFIAAGWPIGWQREIAERFARRPEFQRFLDREELIDAKFVRSCVLSEVLSQCSVGLSRRSARLATCLEAWSHRAYSWRASRAVQAIPADIYHYRSCFGRASVHKAKARGMLTLCDHSIAHPRVLSFLVENQGGLPSPPRADRLSPLEQSMDDDLNLADHVVVNSDFVRDTCLHTGMKAGRIHVIYWGIDDKFNAVIPALEMSDIKGRQKDAILYAGCWQHRKGVVSLAAAVQHQGMGLRLEVAGPIDTAMTSNLAHASFLKSKNVKLLGNLPRNRLAEAMLSHRIFVFPSLCEGSARVIFEAMACGCYIITTPNSGSIVRDGVHGRLVNPGDHFSLAEAITWARSNPDEVAEIGLQNAKLIRTQYRQKHYAEAVESLYSRLLVAKNSGSQ